MDISTLIGWVMAVGLIVWGIGFSKLGNFWDPQSLAIVLGGAIAALIASYPFRILKEVPKHILICFRGGKYNVPKLVDQLVDLAMLARQSGLLALEEKAEEEAGGRPSGDGQFYKGTLRSGQVLEAEGSIVMLGDVNPGARIVAKGNIIVLGALRGTAIAGLGGRKRAIVVALEMDPIQIRIGEVTARMSGRKKPSDDAQIAYLDMGMIHVESLCGEAIDGVSFP